MNIENFKEFLKNPSRLYQLSYQELKSLVLQYPYSTNLHYLLLQKSAMEDHRDLEQNHQKAATYSIDRTFLFNLLRDLTLADKKEPILQLDEDFLELKDLSFLEIDDPSLESVEGPQQAFPVAGFPELDLEPSEGTVGESEKTLDITFDDSAPSPPEPAAEVSGDEEIPTPVVEPPISHNHEEEPGTPAPDAVVAPLPLSYQAPHSLILSAAAIAGIAGQVGLSRTEAEPIEKASPVPPPPTTGEIDPTPSLDMQKQLLDKLNSLIRDRAAAAVAVKKPAPQPKVNFTSWVQQFQPDHVKQQLSDIMEAKKRDELQRLKKKQKKSRKKKKKSDKDQQIVQFAEKSLTSHQMIVSETLAELLAEQGETQKSIEMYERLKLFFPEKSTYFAAIIEKLKTK